MKVAGYDDRSAAAWDEGVVGVWYGGWTADDWREACRINAADPWSYLRELSHQQDLDWDFTPDIASVHRFEAIAPDDWVVVYLRDRAEIGLARLEPEIRSMDDHPLNKIYDSGVKEIFKFRKISESKTFRLSDVPDAYRLLPAQGRGNVHEFHAMYGHVRLLAESDDAAALLAALRTMQFDELVDLLGAAAWESVCTAYLTLEHNFVPTGLSTGLTLPVFDIVGRGLPDGVHILAQCKKNPGTVQIDENFAAAIRCHRSPLKAFYFAFGGCHGDVPHNVEVIGRKEILGWTETDRGAMYRRFMIGQS